MRRYVAYGTCLQNGREGDHPAMVSCIRCGEARPVDLGGLCTSCQASTRTEVNVGMRRLGEYLAAWAAFDAWLRAHGRGASTA